MADRSDRSQAAMDQALNKHAMLHNEERMGMVNRNTVEEFIESVARYVLARQADEMVETTKAMMKAFGESGGILSGLPGGKRGGGQ